MTIDPISVRLAEIHDNDCGRLSNLDLDEIDREARLVRDHDRLLIGGSWAAIALGYDDGDVFDVSS